MPDPSQHALDAARPIADYCSTRFPTDAPPWDGLDVPWFAEKVQQAIDAATADRDHELALLREAIDEARADRRHRVAELEAANARLRAALETIRGWDCLNPPDPRLCGDHPWLKRLVDDALKGA